MTQRHISHHQVGHLYEARCSSISTSPGLAIGNQSINTHARLGCALCDGQLSRFVRPELPALDPQISLVRPVGRDSCQIAISCSVNNQEQLGPHVGDTHLGHGTVDKLRARQGYTPSSRLAEPIDDVAQMEASA